MSAWWAFILSFGWNREEEALDVFVSAFSSEFVKFTGALVVDGLGCGGEVLKGDQGDAVFCEDSTAHGEEVKKFDLDIEGEQSELFAHDFASHRAFGQGDQTFDQGFKSSLCLFSRRFGGERERRGCRLGRHGGSVVVSSGFSGVLEGRHTNAKIGQISRWKPEKMKYFFTARRDVSACLRVLCTMERKSLALGLKSL